ncbi:YeeE/YedE family protein [Algirhabdus cladophorae]|uniref:YeeE/YedE family protein n=1 Tax=Algirhabdus cladophorae TaxID=3377108 RepID=UPI003B84B1C8
MPMDWILGLTGGVMIGCAAALYLLLNGQIMGASGILGSLVDGLAGPRKSERGMFLLGLIGAPALVVAAGLETETQATSNVGLLVIAGLLVGLGTRIGNGCTSGHGVCGISRLSPRGIVSTLVYISAGAVTVVALRSIWGAL